MNKIKKYFLLFAVSSMTILATFPALAASRTLTFTAEPAQYLPQAHETAVSIPADTPTPYINSDGSFTIETSGGVGETLVSSSFKFSSTTSQINITAFGEPDSYTVYLEKKSGLSWKIVKTVTYYTGNLYGYTFTDLSTSATYRLRFFSPDGKITGTGTISNYAG
jgi:hypothetical protein